MSNVANKFLLTAPPSPRHTHTHLLTVTVITLSNIGLSARLNEATFQRLMGGRDTRPFQP